MSIKETPSPSLEISLSKESTLETFIKLIDFTSSSFSSKPYSEIISSISTLLPIFVLMWTFFC
jgi:hypothetical protein